MAQQLLREKDINQDPEDPYVTRMIQVSYLTAHPELLEDNPELDTSDDTEIMFASTMKALLSDLAATVTQARLDYLHKGLDLPGKPTQLIESQIKMLMDQDIFDTLIAKKKAAKRHRFYYVQIGVFQTEGQQMGSEHSYNVIQKPFQEPNLRITSSGGGEKEKSAAAHDNQGDTGTSANPRPAKAQTACRGAKIQDGDSVVHLPNVPQKRLFDVPRPPGYAHAYPGIQAVSEVPTLSSEWSLLPVSGPTIRTITDPLESSRNVDSPLNWLPNAPTTPGAQESLSFDIEIMNFYSEIDDPSHPETIIL
ncbi:hypothetical protein AYI70_g12344 [Smittium culicis]|uniref:Uncharacterized protein n=1 Tax=Smittium culicis TaxID=133412 RepID=A0A1R1WXU1_9FUNG|nr:hypothetical protein AYI70_g12344 [Smittium culicis]